MKKGVLAALLLAAALLSGCTALLERSYSVVEPYADRYWDSGAEDTLRVDNYQDLVNSLLLLVEEHAEEGVIRCYGEVDTYQQAAAAREEVRQETTLGSYLLRDLSFKYERGTSYNTIVCTMTYREDAEDIASLITISDSQSLVDLLRLAVREDLEKQTVRFSYDTPHADVVAAVEELWQELYRADLEARQAELEQQQAELEAQQGEQAAQEPQEPADPGAESLPDGPDNQTEAPPEEPAEAAPEVLAETPPEDAPEPTEDVPAEEPEPIDYPPCPWQIKYYPNNATAEIVEVILKR